MQRFEWDDRFSLGITLLDGQHKAWVERLNNLSAAIESKQEAQQISKTLNFMAGYSEFHFAAEEELMAAHGYPGLERHKLEHNRFRDVLAGLMLLQTGKADTLAKISDSVNNFQISWLKNHITTADRKFADFLYENVSEKIPEGL
jgi:hemerythrin